MMGTQMIIFGGLRSHDVEEGPTDTTGIETEVLDFETGESRAIAPLLSQDKFSYGIALYFVDDAKYCEFEEQAQTWTEPAQTWTEPAQTWMEPHVGGDTTGHDTAVGGAADGF